MEWGGLGTAPFIFTLDFSFSCVPDLFFLVALMNNHPIIFSWYEYGLMVFHLY